MTRFFNRTTEKETRRQLRGESPRAEGILLSSLRDRQLLGMKSRRQHSVGPYIIDLYCARLKLAIELDSESHSPLEVAEYDIRRQQFIESFGIRFLRFTNDDVFENLEGVLEVIATAIKEMDP